MLNEHNLHVLGKKIVFQCHIFLLKTYIFGGKSVITFKSNNENLKENVFFNQMLIFIQVNSGNYVVEKLATKKLVFCYLLT